MSRSPANFVLFFASVGLVIGFANCSSPPGLSAPDVPSEEAQKVGYFVDATNGSDSNSGNSANSPWKSLAKVSGATFDPGTVINLKRGEVWQEQLDIPSSGVTIDAYGSGSELPLIDGSVEVKDWTSEGGDLYSQQVTLEANETLGNVSEDGIMLSFLPWKSTPAATFSSAASGTFSFEYSQKKLFIKVSGNPSGKTYRASRKLYGIKVVGKSEVLIRNLKITRFSLNGVNFQNCQNCSVKGAMIWNGGGAVLGSNPSGNPSYIYGGNGIEFDTNSSGGSVEDSNILGIFDSGISPQTYANNQLSSGISFRKTSITKCGFAGVEISILSNGGTTGSQIKNIDMAYLTISDSGRGWSGRRYGSEGNGIRVQADPGAGTISGVSLQKSAITGSAGVGIKIVGDVGLVRLSRLWVSHNNKGIEALDPIGNSLQLDLSASLIFNNTGGGVEFNAPYAAGLSVNQNTFSNNPPINFGIHNQAGLAKIRNNIFYGSAALTHLYVASPLKGDVAVNNNCYNEMVNMIGYNGIAHQTVVSFRGATGFENQGVGGNVSFVNPANAGFNLQAGSQCRGIGDPSVGISLDINGVGFSSPPPSGAVE